MFFSFWNLLLLRRAVAQNSPHKSNKIANEIVVVLPKTSRTPEKDLLSPCFCIQVEPKNSYGFSWSKKHKFLFFVFLKNKTQQKWKGVIFFFPHYERKNWFLWKMSLQCLYRPCPIKRIQTIPRGTTRDDHNLPHPGLRKFETDVNVVACDLTMTDDSDLGR